MTTLADIRLKVRRVIKSPSANHITNAQIDDYVNDFYLYDFPAHLKTWNLKTVLSPLGLAGADDALIPDRAIYAFDWFSFTNLEGPFYVGGYEIQLFQDVQSFMNIFPVQNRRQQLSTGTGIAGPYGGTITQTPVLEQGVFISAVNNAGVSLHCTANNAGVLTGDVLAGGTINYQTGVVAGLTWNAGVIAVGEPIWVQSITYASGRPEAVLFYDGALLFYPVPDIAYDVACTVYQTPTALAGAGDGPLVPDWWNLLSYGACLKIFGDRLDMESYRKTKILFDEQKRLVERRTLKQISINRTATIYENQHIGVNPYSSGH